MSAAPAFATRRRLERATRGHEVARIAELLGAPLMPWQRQVADVALEVDEDGEYCYREVFVSVPRQSGKTLLVLCLELQRVLECPGGTVVYTAQTGSAAHKKLIEEHGPMVERSELGPIVEKVHRALGFSRVMFANGARIVPEASTREAGHGMTVDLAVIDEAFADVDDRREQALLAAMATRSSGQLVVCSTEGTDESAYLNRKMSQAADAVASDSGSGMCAFVWSAGSVARALDRDEWARFHPAIGHTIGPAVLEHAAGSMGDPEFARAFGNVRHSLVVADRVIPADRWAACADADAAPDGPVVFGVEVALDRSAAAVVAVDGVGRCEVLRSGPGVGWVAEWLPGVVGRHGGRVVVDGRGPAAALVAGLRSAGVDVAELGSAESARACAGLVDRVVGGGLRVRPSAELDDAVGAAVRRWSGDVWFWSRRDVGSVLVWALTVAAWVAVSEEQAPPAVAPWVMV